MLGVIGGSGFYSFFGSDARAINLDTPYGAPSAPITVGTVGTHEVAFLPRHGVNHEFSPHTVPYRANMWALRALGVRRIFGPCAVGSLTAALGPGATVVPDQLVDRTSGRDDTYFDSGGIHVGFADPYCPALRAASAALPGRGDAGAMAGCQVARFFLRCRKPVVRKPGLRAGEHDRLPRGGAGPRTRNMLCGNCFSDRSRCGHRVWRGSQGRRRVRRVRAQPGAVQEARARGHRPGGRRTDVHPLPAARWRRVAVRSAMRVLLTGAAGFIGTRVAVALADAGHDVIAVDVMLAKAHGPGAAPPAGVQLVDIRGAKANAPLLEGVDVVCHQAAVVGAGVDAADAPLYG